MVDVINIIMNLVWILLGATVLGGIAFYFAVIKQYKHKVRVKEICDNGNIVTDVMAKEKRDKDGSVTWRLTKFKKEFPIPPNNCIEIDTKGRKTVVMYLTETGEHFYAKDDSKIMPLPQEISEEKDEAKKIKLTAAWNKEHQGTRSYQPYTAENRYFLINQDKKAAAMRKKPWTEHIPMIAGMMSVTIIAVMLMIFWGDIAEPALDGQKLQLQTIQVQQEVVQELKELKQDIQTIKSEANIVSKEDGGTANLPPN